MKRVKPMKVKYKSGFKYQLAEAHHHYINLPVGTQGDCGQFIISAPNFMILKAGYACDGPSGPTFDTKTFMRGAFIHDALYQMIRAGILPESFRKTADKELYCICLEDGMNIIRASYVYSMVRLFGGISASPDSKKEVQTAP